MAAKARRPVWGERRFVDRPWILPVRSANSKGEGGMDVRVQCALNTTLFRVRAPLSRIGKNPLLSADKKPAAAGHGRKVMATLHWSTAVAR